MSLLAQLLAADLVDELCLTQTPTVVGGQQTRITSGYTAEKAVDLQVLLEEGAPC